MDEGLSIRRTRQRGLSRSILRSSPCRYGSILLHDHISKSVAKRVVFMKEFERRSCVRRAWKLGKTYQRLRLCQIAVFVTYNSYALLFNIGLEAIIFKLCFCIPVCVCVWHRLVRRYLRRHLRSWSDLCVAVAGWSRLAMLAFDAKVLTIRSYRLHDSRCPPLCRTCRSITHLT